MPKKCIEQSTSSPLRQSKNATQVERTPSQHHRSMVAPLSDEADEEHVTDIGSSVAPDDIPPSSVTRSTTLEHVDKY